MSEIELNASDFKIDFPEFVGKLDPFIDRHITMATAYCSKKNGCLLKCCDRKLAIELMTAHLITLSDRATANANGGSISATGMVSSATIGSVSVSMLAPPSRTQFEYWLNQTPYGQQYLALLIAKAPSVIYAGGSRQRVLR